MASIKNSEHTLTIFGVNNPAGTYMYLWKKLQDSNGNYLLNPYPTGRWLQRVYQKGGTWKYEIIEEK